MQAAYKVPENNPVHSFLAKCDPKAEMYVTHIASANAYTRKLQFLMQLGMNLVWISLLLRRGYRGLVRYGVWFVIGKLTPKWGASAPSFSWGLLGNVFLDLFIFLVLVPTIREFISGVAVMRWHHGFPTEEVVFRKPSQSTIGNVVSEAPEKRDVVMKDLIRRAVDPEEMQTTAFGLPWEEWAYDYKAMAAACEMDKKGIIISMTWELCVWMKMKDGWSAIEQGEENDFQNQVGMMEKLRDRLRAMGKTHVFNQMMEVIQVKTMSKEGTPLPVTEDVDAIIADIFKRNDMDFEKLTSELSKNAPPPARFANVSKKND